MKHFYNQKIASGNINALQLQDICANVLNLLLEDERSTGGGIRM